MPRSAVMSAALALAAIAVLGVYLGMGRGIPGPGGFRGETYVVARSSGSGRTVMAEPPPPLPALDEGAIRKIAREEAEAALTRGRPAAAPRKAARADTDSDAASAAGGDNADTGDSAATPVHTPTPPPASTPPTTPPAGPPDL